MTDHKVTVDGKSWKATSSNSEYDAVHAAAGAILAGADRVRIEQIEQDDGELAKAHHMTEEDAQT